MQIIPIQYKPLRIKAIRLFRKQWQLMSKGMSKQGAYNKLAHLYPEFEKQNQSRPAILNCFLCDFRDTVRGESMINCIDLCPIKWDNNQKYCACTSDKDLDDSDYLKISKKPVRAVKYT